MVDLAESVKRSNVRPLDVPAIERCVVPPAKLFPTLIPMQRRIICPAAPAVQDTVKLDAALMAVPGSTSMVPKAPIGGPGVQVSAQAGLLKLKNKVKSNAFVQGRP